MELAFAKKSLRQLCESEPYAKRYLGVRVAEKLKRRLADLRAAEYVNDIVAGRPHELAGADHGQVALELCDGFRIVFSPNHHTISFLGDGNVDWSKISRIKLLRIEGRHD